MINLIHFKKMNVILHGGYEFDLEGILKTGDKNILVYGLNGCGKSLMLSVISHIFHYPAGEIKNIDRNKVQTHFGKRLKVATVRQNASHNFASNSIIDEYKLVYADSEFDEDKFKIELNNFLTKNADLKASIITRNYRTLSSGEKQIISIALALLSNADLILLDEPIARLSNKYALRLIELLDKRNNDSYTIMTTHVSEMDLTSRISNGLNSHLIIKNENRLEVCQSMPTAPIKIPQNEILVKEICVDEKSFESEASWSKDFTVLPTNSVRCIKGDGQPLNNIPIEMEIKLGRTTITKVSGLCLSQGLNILYGDNGAGKSLTAQMLGNKYYSNKHIMGWFSGNLLKTAGEFPLLKIASSDENVPSETTFKWLSKNLQSFYLPGESDSFLVDDNSVYQELSHTCDQSELQDILDWLMHFNIKPQDFVKNLSYGQKKVLTFSEVPSKLVLPILDEPLANLAYEHQIAVCKKILQNIKSGLWYSVIITTNRPLETLELFHKSQVISNE